MATPEYKRIIVRQGSATDFQTLQEGNGLLEGEFAYTTDDDKLYIGTGSGNSQEVATGNVVKTINGEAPNATTGAITISPKDVIGGTPSNGEILEYDSTTQDWVPGVNHEVTGFSAISEEGTTTLKIAQNSDNLNTVNLVLSNVLPIEELSNVAISDLQPNQILKYNGTAWVNEGDANTQTIVDSLTIDSNHLVTLGQTNDVADITLDLSGIGNKTVKSFGYKQTTNFLCLDSNDDITTETDEASCEAIPGNTWTEQVTTDYGKVDLILEDDTVITLDITQSEAGLSGTVTNFVLSDNTKIQLSVEGRETPYEVDISGIRDSLINSVSFNTSNDGVLTLGTIGGTDYTVDLDGRYLNNTHTHGKINFNGQIDPTQLGVAVDVETGDKLVIVNTGSSNAITTPDISFDTEVTDKFLRQDGSFSQVDYSNLANNNHGHGIIKNDGTILTTNISTLQTGDYIMIAKNNDGAIKLASVTFNTTETNKFLSQDGTFKAPTVGNYSETVIDTLDSSNTTELISNLSSYDKVMAVLYPNFTGTANTTTNGDTVPIYVSEQLNFVQTSAGNVCFNGFGDPILGPTNESECSAAGGTWTPQYINNYGRVPFQPGGSIERINSTQVRFNLPSAVTGVEWKLKLIGVTF